MCLILTIFSIASKAGIRKSIFRETTSENNRFSTRFLNRKCHAINFNYIALI